VKEEEPVAPPTQPATQPATPMQQSMQTTSDSGDAPKKKDFLHLYHPQVLHPKVQQLAHLHRLRQKK
jgi:hypothetical protein